MKIEKIWAVRVIDDPSGRTMRDAAFFFTEHEANRYANSDQGRDMYGGRGSVVKRDFKLFQTAEEAGAMTWGDADLELEEVRNAREAVISKLTPGELELLGTFCWHHQGAGKA